MELLLVTGCFPERSETFIYRKIVALADRGHNVTVATRRVGDWSLYPDRLPATLRLEKLPPDDNLRDPRRALAAIGAALRTATTSLASTRRLLALCAAREASATERARLFLQHLPFLDRRVDVVHFEFLHLAAMYPLASRVIDAPVVVSCRGNDIHTLELRAEREQRRAIQTILEATAVHCVSEEMASEVTRLTGRDKGLWVNRPAVETKRIKVRPPSNSRSGPLKLLATGRLVWKKGFDYLLAVMARLLKRDVSFTLEILGDGPLKSHLRFSIDDLGLHDHVTLVGGVSSKEVLTRLQQTDVFVLSSFEEGISNAVLEAMASGVPVVTTSAGGMREAVTDGREGYVVPVRDVTLMADRIEYLAKHPETRTEMGAAARERAVRDFSLERQVMSFEALYRSIAAS